VEELRSGCAVCDKNDPGAGVDWRCQLANALVWARSRRLVRGAAIDVLKGVPPDLGIAGIKESGYCYEGGMLGIEAFLNLKVVRGSAPDCDISS
jgi:hypothetical protein